MSFWPLVFPWNTKGVKWSLSFLLNCMSQNAVLSRPRSAFQQLAKVHLSVTVRDVNTAIMELLIMAYALKTSCAKNIIGVIPYFPYSKQCKMRKRGSIVCKLLASMLAKAGKGLWWWLSCSYFCFHRNSQKCGRHSQSLLLYMHHRHWLTAFSDCSKLKIHKQYPMYVNTSLIWLCDVLYHYNPECYFSSF